MTSCTSFYVHLGDEKLEAEITRFESSTEPTWYSLTLRVGSNEVVFLHFRPSEAQKIVEVLAPFAKEAGADAHVC